MIRLIAIIDKSRGIAKNGQQFLALPDDQTYFGYQTKLYGGNVLMGRKTYQEAIGHPLPKRHNYVAAHKQLDDSVITVTDVPAFLTSFAEDIWVIGGASIYTQAMPFADELYLTHVAADYNCDQFFPPYPDFKLQHKSEPLRQNDANFYYAVYTRKE
jgi:dihydrofolate reductase